MIFRNRGQHSMLRRCRVHDYQGRSIYLITINVERRKPVLGTLRGTENTAYIELSVLGHAVDEEWQEIIRENTEIISLCHQIMPDHFHGIPFVQQRLQYSIGEMIRRFKMRTTRRMRELQPSVPELANLTRLWEEGYHDRLLLHDGQLQSIIDYVKDNPRRLAMRRAHPEYFVRLHKIVLAGKECSVFGNSFLLMRPGRIPVQCSRRLTPEQITSRTNEIIEQCLRNQDVIVSPCISPGERAIALAAINAAVPVIAIRAFAFPAKFKPAGKFFDACSRGLLLVIAPPWVGYRKEDLTREMCLEMNQFAQALCSGYAAAACMDARAPDQE